MPKVCLAPTWTLTLPTFGGNLWVYLNWALGLQDNGCKVVWLEAFPRRLIQGKSEGRTFEALPTAEILQRIDQLRTTFASVGLDAPIALIMTDEDRLQIEHIRHQITTRTISLDEASSGCDLLLSLNYSLSEQVVAQFARTSLLDIDPGFLQHWIVECQVRLAPYDTYFTIGETIGTARTQVPGCGLSWRHTPPVVHLPSWPRATANTGAYTSVSGWWIGWDQWDGQVIDNRKRSSFLRYAELPSRTSAQLELALDLGPDDTAEKRSLEQHGWKVRNSASVTALPEQYKNYVQRSKGEFSCAKLSYVSLETAWVSDRTLCYLASGKPVVVEHTGNSHFLPDAEGMFRFRDLNDAVRCIEAAEADYERHCRLARLLAEEFFDAAKVSRALLETALW